MGSFPQHLFSLILASLCFSTIGMVFGALAITLSPIIWIIPAIIALTFIYHTFILLVASAETYHSPRLYTPYTIGCAYILSFFWTATLAVSIAVSCLLLTDVVHTTDDKIKIWMLILSSVSLLESALLGYMAVMSHKEMKQIRYQNKWRWRIDITGVNSPQWRSVECFSSTEKTR
ncbi:hypothetical protein GALMADRAFT_98125 [Galerina marginata CBS 339.88]|uniref:MARVEL domain-containing protein n=1 Tax=Galerina marginata (strain CBS 339.88) TaxID=685588 RepID=A0A067T7R8_GALM3|nr:hypothetical protein GALMADRAFT_98125 [Galerina marginata CBS 339.88]